MSENTDQLNLALDTVQKLLSGLPTDYCIAKLDAVIQRLSQSWAFAKLHRDWQLGSSEGIKSCQLRKQVGHYFKSVYSPAARNTKTIAEKKSREALAALSIRAHLINSASYTVGKTKELHPDIIKQMTQDHLIEKFMVVIWSGSFMKMTRRVILDLGIRELTIAFISIDTQQKDISQTSPVEELSCVEPIQTFQGHEANKRNWSERQRSEENISPTETATQKRRRVSISKTINDSSLAISTKGPTSQSNDRDVSNPPKQMNKDRRLHGICHQITFESIQEYWDNGLKLSK
ncbi:hypothetical protein FPOA_13452 [Fusarium poae]|uniref:Uncharacterized protein n=1 Tax=Fusarium poae TaxID=36050 RepID=A0A1B8A5L7_FUSPO|nr:hypothetical protein FPOA_13452 [Fusarium poae]